jgi:hypothetical protein
MDANSTAAAPPARSAFRRTRIFGLDFGPADADSSGNRVPRSCTTNTRFPAMPGRSLLNLPGLATAENASPWWLENPAPNTYLVMAEEDEDELEDDDDDEEDDELDEEFDDEDLDDEDLDDEDFDDEDFDDEDFDDEDFDDDEDDEEEEEDLDEE